MTVQPASRASRNGGRRAAGWHRACSILIALFSVCRTSLAISADPSPISLIPVNVERPETWPEGDWLPVPGRELKELAERLRPIPKQPQKVWIERATYSAVFDGKSLRGGRLNADIRHDGKQPQLLSLEPLNLAVSEMNWVEAPAVWGTLGSGQSALYVDGKFSTLVGHWSLTGRQLPRSVEFDVQVPSAAVNRIRLIVREGDVVSTSTGEGRWVELKGQTGLRQWEVDLGSQTRCRLKIRDRPDQKNMTPLVLSETTHSYVVREDGVQFQAEFLLEAANAPVNVLLFTIPSGIDIYSVSYGRNSPLAWRLIPSAEDQMLAVELADPLSGASRPIRIDGTAATEIGRAWKLPQSRFRHAFLTSKTFRTMRDGEFVDVPSNALVNTVFVRGDVHLKIESPLQLQAVKFQGLRQTATVSTPEVSRSLSFQQYQPDAQLTIVAEFPKLRRRAGLVSYVDTTDENWLLTSHIMLSTDAGETFVAEFQLAPLWEVIEVRPLDDTSTWTDWYVRRQKGGRRTLSIEFRDAIAPGMPKAVEVIARRLPLSMRRPLRIPFLRPLSHHAAEQVIAVSHTGIAVDLSASQTSFRTLTTENPPEFVVDSGLWQRIETTSDGELLLVYSDKIGDQEKFQLRPSGPTLAAEVWTTERVESVGVRETFDVQLRPKGEGIDRVRVYLSVADGDVAWKLNETDSEFLTANRVAFTRHADGSLPSEGELWEIQLPRLFRQRVSIIGTRVRSNSSSLMATLATIPDAEPFQGIVELQSADGMYVNTQVDGPVAVDSDTVGFSEKFVQRQRRPVGRVWNYRSPQDSIQLRLRGSAGELQLRQTAVLNLQSVLSDEFPGFDRHRATLRLLESRVGGEIRFELPHHAVLLSTLLNGKLVSPYRRDNDWVVAHPGDGISTTVQIEYQSSTGGGRFVRKESIPLPKVPYTVINFDWEFATPPDTWVVSEPSGMMLIEQLPQLSWTERFFGPLGRPIGRAMFTPFSSQAWSALRGAKREIPKTALDNLNDSFSPAGWELYHAKSSYLPDELTLVTRRHSVAWLLAWVGTLGCLLCGLLMRFRQSEFRKSVFGYWLSICLFAAWLSPPFYALIAGGCVVGTAVALLLPRRLLERLHFKNEPADIVPGGSTASIRRVPVATLLLIAVLSAAHAFAIEPPDIGYKRTKNVPGDVARLLPIRVLAPRENGAPAVADSDIVYVESDVLKKLRREFRLRDSEEDYLISSAKYAANIDDRNAAVVSADYDVYLLPGCKAARVRFPMALANPSRCRVNGKPHPIVLGDDGKTFFVEVMSPVNETTVDDLFKFEINIEFRPATQMIAGAYSYRLNTIAVASARLEQKFSQPLTTIEINGSQGEQSVATDHRSLSVLLGKTEQFEVVWSEKSLPGKTLARLEAAVATHAMVRPTWLEVRYRVNYRVLSGQVDFVAWNLPRAAKGLVVQEITIDGSPVEAFSTSANDDKSLRVFVEFAASRQKDFVVEAVVVHPVSADGRGLITVAAATIVDESAQQYEVVQSRNVLAVSAPSEFDITSPTPAQLADGLREIDVETYDALVGEVQVVRPSRLAFEVLGKSSEIPVALTPVNPIRKVRLIQTGTIQADVLHWSLTADVETSRAPVFRHRLQVPTDLEVTEISVREDNVERLVHWSRKGNIVELFLSDKSNGIQSLLLEGQLRLRRGRPTALPLIQIEQAEMASTRVRLLRDSQVSVELLDIESFAPIENGIAAIADGKDLELVGQFRVLPESVPPQIRVTPQSDQVQMYSVIRITGQGKHQLRVDYRYQFESGDGGRPIETVRMRMSSDVANRMRVESPAAEIVRNTLADGSVELLITSKSESASLLSVRVVSIVDEPPPGDWALPQIEVVGDYVRERYLFIPNELGLQPVGRRIQVIRRETLLPRVRLLAEAGNASDAWGLYRFESEDLSFFVGLSDSQQKSSQITFVESQIAHNGNDSLFGHTIIYLSHLEEDEIQLDWPRKAELRAIFVDGVDAAAIHRDTQSGRVSVPIAAGSGPHRVDLHWSQAIEETASRWSLRRQSIPMPRGMTVTRSIVKIVPPNGMFYSARDPLLTTNDWDYSLDRLQGLYEVNRSQMSESWNRPLWEAMQRQRQKIRTRLSNSSADSIDPGHRQRFNRIDLAVVELETKLSNANVAVSETIAEQGEANRVQTAEGDLDAPNRSLLSGRIKALPSDSQIAVSYWAFGNWTVAAILLLLGLPLIPMIRWLVRMEIGQWLFRHQPAAWAVLGLLWWSCLRPSEFGLVLLLVSLCVAVWEWRRNSRATDFVVDISTDESENMATSSQ